MPARLKLLVFLFLLLCLLPTETVFAKAPSEWEISGVVRDQAGNSVPGATVSLYSATALVRRFQTGSDGGFSFADLLPGAYVLECSKDGFQDQSRRIALGSQSEILEVTLAVAGVHQQITVIAADLPELPAEIAKAISVIRPEELQNRDVLTLTDALQAIPALQTQQLGGPGTVASYRFRGLRAQDTAILLDGFRFRDPADIQGSARPLLSDLLVTDAERIEVLRGAGSALYGTHSIGGAVNVVSRRPSEPFQGSVLLEGGSLGFVGGAAEMGGQAARRRFSYFFHADHLNYTRGMDGTDAYRNNSGNALAAYDITPQARLFLRVRSTDSFASLNESPTPLPNLPPLPAGVLVREPVAYPNPGATFLPQSDDPDDHQANRFFSGAARLDHQVNHRWAYSAGFESLRTRRRYDDGPAVSHLAGQLGYEEGPTTLRQNYEGATEQAFWRSSIQASAGSSFQAGVDFGREALNQAAYGLVTEAEQRSLALSLGNVTRWLDGRLHVQLAFQAQRYGLDPPRFSDDTRNPFASVARLDVPATYNGDASIAYFLARSSTKFRLHGGNGYRAPSLFERFGSGGSGLFRSYYGDPRLRPERSSFLDGGFDQYLFRNRMQVSATYFYTHLETILDFGSTPGDPFARTFGYVNRKGGNARGAELAVSFRPTRFLDLTGSYTFTKSNQPSATSAGTTRVLGLSDHQFSFAATLKPAAKATLHLLVTGVSDCDFPVFGLTFTIPAATFRFPGTVRVDLTGTYVLVQGERMRLRFVTRVDNLTNREYYQGGFLAPPATVRSGLRVDF